MKIWKDMQTHEQTDRQINNQTDFHINKNRSRQAMEEKKQEQTSKHKSRTNTSTYKPTYQNAGSQANGWTDRQKYGKKQIPDKKQGQIVGQNRDRQTNINMYKQTDSQTKYGETG